MQPKDLKDESTFGVVLDHNVLLVHYNGVEKRDCVHEKSIPELFSFCALHFKETRFTSSGIVAPENSLVYC